MMEMRGGLMSSIRRARFVRSILKSLRLLQSFFTTQRLVRSKWKSSHVVWWFVLRCDCVFLGNWQLLWFDRVGLWSTCRFMLWLLTRSFKQLLYQLPNILSRTHVLWGSLLACLQLGLGSLCPSALAFKLAFATTDLILARDHFALGSLTSRSFASSQISVCNVCHAKEIFPRVLSPRKKRTLHVWLASQMTSQTDVEMK